MIWTLKLLSDLNELFTIIINVFFSSEKSENSYYKSGLEINSKIKLGDQLKIFKIYRFIILTAS